MCLYKFFSYKFPAVFTKMEAEQEGVYKWRDGKVLLKVSASLLSFSCCILLIYFLLCLQKRSPSRREFINGEREKMLLIVSP